MRVRERESQVRDLKDLNLAVVKKRKWKEGNKTNNNKSVRFVVIVRSPRVLVCETQSQTQPLAQLLRDLFRDNRELTCTAQLEGFHMCCNARVEHWKLNKRIKKVTEDQEE
ncbi:hypothetical protein RUM43_000150 [Polyplax serrata]|uniref:Uncharacterized protein n=1 Tax=Polyplax serrata TaxID=468196 RepID=A0AAN8XPW1_POLSC